MRTMLLSGNHPLLNTIRAPIKMPHPLDLDGDFKFLYPDVETYFQAQKALFIFDSEGRTFEEAHDWVIQSDLKPGQRNWREAKKRARNLKINVVAWDRAAFAYMLQGHSAKFQQITEYQKILMATRGRYLIEHRPDRIWGDNLDGGGLNLCGISLMIVRDRILS